MSVTKIYRRLAVAIAIQGAMTCPSWGVVKHWNSNSGGNWGTAGNWSPSGAPQINDEVWIGLFTGANDWVTLDQSPAVDDLHVSDGMSLDTSGHSMLVFGNTSVHGENQVGDVRYPSRLRVAAGVGPVDFDTENLYLTDGALFDMRGGTVEVDDYLSVDDASRVSGHGVIRLKGTGNPTFKMDGTLHAGHQGLLIEQLESGRIDLDGAFEDGVVNATTVGNEAGPGSRLTIRGDQLLDGFDGLMTIVPGAYVDMDLSGGWTLGTGGELRMFGGLTAPFSSLLKGKHVDVRGTVAADGAFNRIQAPATVHDGAQLRVSEDSKVELTQSTTVEGGSFQLKPMAEFRFTGPTTLRGGDFVPSGVGAGTSAKVSFQSTTSWEGNVDLGVVAVQEGPAVVNAPSIVTATVLDMDGFAGGGTWTLHDSLTVHAGSLESNGSSYFNGTINNLSSALFGSVLAIHLDQPGEAWTMAGTMNLGGHNTIVSTRVAGSPMRVTGELNVSDKVEIAADATLESGGVLNLASLQTALRFAGETTIESGANFTGLGTIINTGDMRLADGLDTNFAAVSNAGDLHVGEQVGAVELNRFENKLFGTLHVDIGGVAEGVGHDSIRVDGTVALAGTLAVSFANGFLPTIGDEFTILRRNVGSIQGAFSSLVGHLAPNDVLLLPEYEGSLVKLVARERIACDLTLDGGVDASDMGTMFGQWGGPGSADNNGDGIVDAADAGLCFQDWTGDSAAHAAMQGSSPMSVPEPTGAAAMSLVVAALIARRRQVR